MEKKSPKRKPRAKISTPYPMDGYARLRHTADFLGISDATRYRWERDGKLPKSFEIEKGFFVYDAKEIRVWAESKKSRTGEVA